MSRTSQISRRTGETDITVSLSLEGAGEGSRSTGIGFFDHLLDAFARHGGFRLDVAANGDLPTGSHHTVEDVGIVIGQAIDEALGERAGITRFGQAVVPMDDARAAAAVDVSGRPFVAFEGAIPPRTIGGFETDLVEEFLRAVANNAKLTVHVTVERGRDPHHMTEAAFKAFARALRQAFAIDPDERGVPSTKGLL
jgi:imidazoleglycerol-phosphate dehydratase